MAEAIRDVFARHLSTQTLGRKNPHSPTDFHLELLEPRVLLSVTFDTGGLTVLGSASNEKIIIKAGSDDGTVIVKGDPDGDDGTYAGVNAVTVDAAGGDDKVRVKGNLTDTNGDVLGVTLIGGPGNDNLRGGRGDDTLLGGEGNDTLRGRRGDDTLDGGDDDDKIMGGKGDDMISGGQGNDRLNGQKGNDTVSFEMSPTGVNISLADHRAADDGHGTSDRKLKKFENIIGSNYDDVIEGNGRTETIDGRAGTDDFRAKSSATQLLEHNPPIIHATLLNPLGNGAPSEVSYDSTVTGTITDESSIVSFVVGLDDTPTPDYADALATLQPDGTFTFGFTTPPRGTHTLHLQAIDEHGNTSGTHGVLFTIQSSHSDPSILINPERPVLSSGDEFGRAVSVSGDVVVIGAPFATRADGHSIFTGSAYITDTSHPSDITIPKELRKISTSHAEVGDEFGYSVSISGTTAVIGAPEDDGVGSAYLFNVATGDQLSKLAATDAVLDGRFGMSVSISGDAVVVGAPFGDASEEDSGAAYLFDANTGDQLFKLTASDSAAFDEFGVSVAISGNTAIVGAPNNDDPGSNSGSAYLFDVYTGEQLAKLSASDAAVNGRFGMSVSISGDAAIVGTPGDDDGSGSESGAAYLFDISDPVAPVELAKLTASDAAALGLFGDSVSIDGNAVVVGASDSRFAYLFDVSDPAAPIEVTKLETVVGGKSVAISGNTVVIGVPEPSDTAYLFTVPDRTTIPLLDFD